MRRRDFVKSGILAATLATPFVAGAAVPFRLGLTPVFLDNDAHIIDRLRFGISTALGQPVELIQRRTYQEITAMLLHGSVDSAWICGFPYLQHRERLELIGVPQWRGQPLYQSYLIARDDDAARGLCPI